MQWSVLLPVVLTLVATYDNEDSKYVRFLSDLCYTKWALEAFVISNAKRFVHADLFKKYSGAPTAKEVGTFIPFNIQYLSFKNYRCLPL